MPPLQPTQILLEATALYERITRSVNDVANIQIPRLKQCPGPLALQQKWASEIREDIESAQREIEVHCYHYFYVYTL